MRPARPRLPWLRVMPAILSRLVKILRVVARHEFSRRLGPRLARWPRLARRLPAPDLDPPQRLRVMLEEAGGTFIKFGQMLALQPDIIPRDYCNALFDLLDQIEPFEFSEVERVIREELGRGPAEIFDSFDRQPLATASIGQVHVAYLGRKKVAVKIQRPNVMAEFMGDIGLMTTMMRLVRLLRLRPLYWIIEPLSEFVAWTHEELDYRQEARYANHVARGAKDNPAQRVPIVYREYTTPRVLVAEFLEGTTLLEYLRAREQPNGEFAARRLEPPGFDRGKFAANVIDNFLSDAFERGIYHADLHPANLLILENNVVGYVDFGITGVMSRHARRHLIAMTLALAQGDTDSLSDEFLKISGFGPDSDLRAFRQGLRAMAATWYDDGEVGEQKLMANFTRIMGDMLTLSRQTGVLPERDIVKYIRSAIAIDGLVTRFEPDFEVGRYLGEACARHLAWQMWGERVTPERMLDWMASTGQLLRDGLERSSLAIERLSAEWDSPEGPGEAEDREPERARLRARALQLAGAAFAVALLSVASYGTAPDSLRFGLNLWTSELVFVATASGLLLATLRRLFAAESGG